MSSDNTKVYLTHAEQVYLMEMLEIGDPEEAVKYFADILMSERADVGKLPEYLKKIMKRTK